MKTAAIFFAAAFSLLTAFLNPYNLLQSSGFIE